MNTTFAALASLLLLTGCAHETEQRPRTASDVVSGLPVGLAGDAARGIQLGTPVGVMEQRCKEGKRVWSREGQFSKCSGPGSGTPASWYREARFRACDGAVCGMYFDVDPKDVPVEDVALVLIHRMIKTFGAPGNASRMPAECKGEDALLGCIHSGAAALLFTWKIKTGQWELVHLGVQAGVLHAQVAFFDERFVKLANGTDGLGTPDASRFAPEVRGADSGAPVDSDGQRSEPPTPR